MKSMKWVEKQNFFIWQISYRHKQELQFTCYLNNNFELWPREMTWKTNLLSDKFPIDTN